MIKISVTLMEVKVNIICTWRMPMSEAVTVPSLTMMAATVSKDSLARDTHTQTRVFYVKICKVAYDFANKHQDKIKFTSCTTFD